MNERDLKKALLAGEGPIDPQVLADRVMQRDQRRMRFWAVACVLAWMLVVMLPWATVMPMVAKVVQIQAHINETQFNEAQGGETRTDQGAAAETGDEANPSADSQRRLLPMVVKKGVMATFFGSIAAMLLAAVSTVSLITISRRATLRQLNARLAEISAQFKALAPPSP